MTAEPLLCSLLANARAYPAQPILLTQDGAVSHAEFVAMVSSVAAALRNHGCRRGDRVLICGPNSQYVAAGYFGVHAAGCVAMPIDADTTQRTAVEIAADSGAAVALTDGASSLNLPIPAMDLRAACAGAGGGALADVRCEPDDIADILYTSGTTGRKKGVVLTHRNIAQIAANINEFIQNRRGDVEVVPIPLGHSFGLGRLRCAAQTGATLSLEQGMKNPARVLQRVLDLRANGLAMVPAGFELLLLAGKGRLGDARDHLRYIEIGSAPMRPQTRGRLMELLPRTRICQHYGLTEASRSTFIEFHADREHLDSIGRPSPNVTMAIHDADGRPLGPGCRGEIVVGGPSVMAGYWNQPELSATTLRGGWLHTGDVGFVDEGGYYHLVGRKSDMINVGGLKVSPEEVEREIAAYPGISDTACIGVADPQGITGEVVKAFIVGGAEMGDAKLVAWLRGRLEEYKIPRVFERVDAIPKTPSGKVQRHLLRSLQAGAGRESP